MADPYQALGVERAADAAAIKRAYRRLAKELHPDRNADNPRNAERFKAISAAYDILGDDKKRAAFDRGEIDGDGNPRAHGHGGPGHGFRSGTPGFDFRGGQGDDIFENLFRSGASPFGRQAPQRGGDRSYRLAVPFADAALARPQRLTLADGKTIDLKLPPGLIDGQQLRLAGQGEPGPGGAGDAMVTLIVRGDPVMVRDGDDIRIDLPIGLDEAVLGAKVRVPIVDGAVMVQVGPNATSGRQLRLRGKGWTTKAGGRGDAIVRLLIDVPADDPVLADAIRTWAAGNTHRPRAAMEQGG
jgi:DnaJ-class molecular chaperone